MSLYGYCRKTNPLLEQDSSELLVFRDVVSPNTHTLPCLKAILSFGDHEHPEYYLQKPSLVELFNQAGFETYWISNQHFMGEHNAVHGLIASQAKHLYNLSAYKQQDEVVLPYLKTILSNRTIRKKMIFVHLAGSHMLYRDKYTASFAQFEHQAPCPTPFKPTQEQQATVDAYDNSVLYNDFVLSSLFQQVKAANEYSWVCYLSDHGDEVYDFRDFAGHTFDVASRYMCEIPFILWISGSYKRQNKERVHDMKTYLDRPFSSEHTIHGLGDLADLDSKDLDRHNSLFSREFRSKPRKVGHLDYRKNQPDPLLVTF